MNKRGSLREKTAILLAVVLAIGITGYSAWQLLFQGVLSWHIRQPETGWMFGELVMIWLVCLLVLFCKLDAGLRVAVLAAVVVVFCWLHVMFLPVFLAGVYVAYLILSGKWVSAILLKQRLPVLLEFTLGSACMITCFCMLSLVQLGSIRNLRFFVAVTGIVFLASWLRHLEMGKRCQPVLTGQQAAMLAAIITLLLLQVGRMNLAVDFDSIWYGVRSHVMLDSGNSIYENLGTLGVVYTYSKGWEVLTLPLAGLPSYSFPIAFNAWIAVFLLVAAYEAANVWLAPKSALWVPFILAAIPGVMNMTMTAKADLLTLFFQILMIRGVLCFFQERKADTLIWGLAAGGMSLTLKPTAIIFSSAIVGIVMLWLLWDRYRWRFKDSDQAWWTIENKRIWWMFTIVAAGLTGIWGRTMKLVGVPVTSVFYQACQKIGFQVKYPFYASGFPAAGGSLSLGEKAGFLLRRLAGVLFNPQGDDMAHVIIAWGTVIPVVFLLLLLCLSFMTCKRRQDEPDLDKVRHFLAILTMVILLIDLVSLYSLSQIDGNYYMLTYFLVILTGCIWLEQWNASDISVIRAGRMVLLVPWLFAVIICGLTNWAWSLGFTPIQMLGKGFYPHQQLAKESRAEQGSQAIWEILAANPKNRVIALGEHPGVLTFPCSVQSYVDVSGYWGNPEVVSDAPNFLQYLEYANIDYLYMEKGYVDTSVRIYQIIRTLIAEGYLEDVREEHGNLIISVRKTEPDTAAAAQNLKVFDLGYIQHP